MFDVLLCLILECSGSLELSSSEHRETFEIVSESLKEKKARITDISRLNQEGNRYLYFDIVTMKGNCCWKVWNRYITGISYKVETEGTRHPGWTIKTVQLIKKCGFS